MDDGRGGGRRGGAAARSGRGAGHRRVSYSTPAKGASAAGDHLVVVAWPSAQRVATFSAEEVPAPVQRSGPSVVRGHLRLAPPPGARPATESRARLVLRAVVSTLVVLLRSIAAQLGAVLALAPVAWRRAPLGRRASPLSTRQARVIPFQPRRHPQQQAIPR
jgi:hypothetical protein